MRRGKLSVSYSTADRSTAAAPEVITLIAICHARIDLCHTANTRSFSKPLPSHVHIRRITECSVKLAPNSRIVVIVIIFVIVIIVVVVIIMISLHAKFYDSLFYVKFHDQNLLTVCFSSSHSLMIRHLH